MAQKTRTFRIEVTPEDADLRLDQVLAARVPGLSRRKARTLLSIGGVFVDRRRVKVASRSVRPGQIIEAHIGGALERATGSPGPSDPAGRKGRGGQPPGIPSPPAIVHEDDHIVVVDKPAGVITAPTPESDRGNLADYLRRRGHRSGGQIFVVHRIDLGTSGLLVFAKTDAANRALSARFRDHSIDREYIAVVAGDFPGSQGSGEVAVRVAIAGRSAVTHLRADEVIGDLASVLRARLETGRTHQIRIHCAHLGHPVLGDRRHGPKRAAKARSATPRLLRPPRMALHATVLGLPHPITGQMLGFESPLPPDLTEWLDRLRASQRPDDNGEEHD